MSDEDLPDDFPSEPPPASVRESAKERVRARLESVIPEILKRAVELGVEKARESPDNLKQFVQDLKVPKEVAHYLFQQIDDTKNGMFRVVAKEIRDFLEHTNFSGELQKLLTTVQFEVNTTIRFTPNDRKEPRKSDDDQGDDDGGGGGGEGEGDGDSTGPSSTKAHKPGDSTARSNPPLPKPEIKTAVKVRRDSGDRGVRRRSSRRDA